MMQFSNKLFINITSHDIFYNMTIVYVMIAPPPKKKKKKKKKKYNLNFSINDFQNCELI